MIDAMGMLCDGSHAHAHEGEKEIELMTKGMATKLANIIMKKTESAQILMEKTEVYLAEE